MRKPSVTELARAFLWLTVLAAAAILFWGSDRLWLLIIILLASGWTDVRLVEMDCRGGKHST